MTSLDTRRPRTLNSIPWIVIDTSTSANNFPPAGALCTAMTSMVTGSVSLSTFAVPSLLQTPRHSSIDWSPRSLNPSTAAAPCAVRRQSTPAASALTSLRTTKSSYACVSAGAGASFQLRQARRSRWRNAATCLLSRSWGMSRMAMRPTSVMDKVHSTRFLSHPPFAGGFHWISIAAASVMQNAVDRSRGDRAAPAREPPASVKRFSKDLRAAVNEPRKRFNGCSSQTLMVGSFPRDYAPVEVQRSPWPGSAKPSSFSTASAWVSFTFSPPFRNLQSGWSLSGTSKGGQTIRITAGIPAAPFDGNSAGPARNISRWLAGRAPQGAASGSGLPQRLRIILMRSRSVCTGHDG